MIHYYSYKPDSKTEDDAPHHEPSGHSQRLIWRLLKLLLALTLILLVAAVILAGALYVYINNTDINSTNGRTNVLILGVDEVAKLSDTVLVVSILHEPTLDEPEIAMLSLPRDLLVEIPGFGRSKINAAYALGENNNYPDGGPGLTVATVEQALDIPIHYHAAVGFDGFEKIIDSVGGVEVEVRTAINDPFFPAPGYDGFEPFSIEAGTQAMDGETALKYARSRMTTNDFDRAFRQQQVLVALRNSVMNLDGINSYYRIAALLKTVDEHLITDMNRLELIKAAVMLRGFDVSSMDHYVLDTTNLLMPAAGSDLVPRSGDFSQIQEFVDDIFSQEDVAEFESHF